MRFNNFISSWVKAVDIENDTVIVTLENKTYVIRNITMSDRLKLIEAMVDNANGLAASVGSEIKKLLSDYPHSELNEPVINGLSVSASGIRYNNLTLAYFDGDRFQYIGPAASEFFENLRRELLGAK